MKIGSKHYQGLLFLVVLCFRCALTHLIAAFPAVPPHGAVPVNSVPVFAKLTPHPLPATGAVLAHGTATLIGSIGPGTIVAAPLGAGTLVAAPIGPQDLVPYTAAPGVPVAIPLKLLFERFPPFFERIVQRIQNYYSTYNYPGSDYNPDTSQNHPVATTTTTTPSTTTQTTTTTTTTTTTPAPVSNTGIASGSRLYGDADSYDPSPQFSDQEGSYRYDPPVSNPFTYPDHKFTPQNYYFSRS